MDIVMMVSLLLLGLVALMLASLWLDQWRLRRANKHAHR